jgi:CrcB protein
MVLMKISGIVAVAAGGAIGSVLRYLISFVPCKTDFPLATLIVNLLGAVAIGFIASYGTQKISGSTVLFFKTGMCGGFTTFSTFSLECFGLFESGKTLLGAVYLLISVLGCLIGVWAGTALGKIAAA